MPLAAKAIAVTAARLRAVAMTAYLIATASAVETFKRANMAISRAMNWVELGRDRLILY